MHKYTDLLKILICNTETDKKIVEKAFVFAEEKHREQKRNSGEPYFHHLFETAKILAELGMSGTVIAAGLLHDSVEDVGVTSEEIEKEFNPEIRFLVEGVTKLGKIRYQGTDRYNESLRKLFVAMSKDIRVLIIKLADRLHNMRTLEHVPKEKQLRIAKETLEIYAPIANRLGVKIIQRELEDLAFAYVFPEQFRDVEELLKLKRETQEMFLETFQKSLQKELAKENITNFKLDYRVKGLYSLYKKLLRNNMDVEKIYDISALRVTVKDIATCYRVLGIIHGAWRPLPDRIKDYIASPKLNGYQSIHTTIFTGDGGIIEVQIRTEEMHKEAEYGIASHISYKEGLKKKQMNPNLLWIKRILPLSHFAKEKAIDTLSSERVKDEDETSKIIIPNILSDIPLWVKELVEYQKEAGEEFIEDIKTDFFEERIFVFTPVGDVIDLPIDSSIIDFAYSIHSDIGNHLAGAKVNGKFVAISTILHNGDRVEVETKKNSKPSRKWMEFCKTTMARRHIRTEMEKERK